MEWARSSISAGTDRIPAEVLTTIGKNAMRNAMMTLDVRPNPNHTSRSGANAIWGTSWEATSSGYTAFSNGRQVTMATAIEMPTTVATAKPSSTSSIVGTDSDAR